MFCAVVAAFAQGGGVPIDGIVAVIGKSVILRSDLEKHFNDYTAQFKTVENPDEIYCSILENLVYTKLMVNQAEIDSIEITDEEIDYRINMRMSYFLQQTGGDVKYIENYFNKPMSEIKKDMRELLDAGEPVETRCRFCGKSYVFTMDELREAREEAKAGKTAGENDEAETPEA